MVSRVISLAVVFMLSACGMPDVEVTVEENHKEKPRPVKVVVVTLFEIGEDTGDRAGEFQLWKERRVFDEILPFHGYKDLHYNSEDGLLVIVTGIGTARSAAATMAVGMDPRFDLSKAYWLTAGIAGIDPEDATVGSAAWA